METRIQIVSIVASAGLFLAVFELVRRKRLMERYALLWLFTTTLVLVLAVWKDLLEDFSRAIGIFYAPAALFGVAVGGIFALLLHFSLVVSRLADQSKVLAQRVAILQSRVDELEEERAAARAEDAERVPAGR